MSWSVLDFLISRIRGALPRDVAQRIGILSQWGRRFNWTTLARKVHLVRPDPQAWLREWPLRPVGAFILSYVLVVTVGMLVLPGLARQFKPKPPTSLARVTAGHDVLPGLPSLAAPRGVGPSRQAPARGTGLDDRPTGLDTQARRPASRAGSGEPATAPHQLGSVETSAAKPREQEAKVNSVPKRSNGPRRAPAVAAGPGGAHGGPAKLTGITLWGTPTKPWVSITASGPVRYQLRNVEPNWVVVDVSRAELALAPGKLPAGRGLVKQVRAGQFAPDVARVVLELTGSVPVHISTSPDKTAIIVSLAGPSSGTVTWHRSPAVTAPAMVRSLPAAGLLPASATRAVVSPPPTRGSQISRGPR